MDLQESYQILELEKTNCLQEVKQAYRDIVFVWHPDRLESNHRVKKKAEKKLQQINLAYDILKQHLSDKLPEFSKIIIAPSLAEVEYHQSKVFTAYGIDNQGQEIEIEQVKWQTSGGTIYQDGLFFADDALGNYKITASFSSWIAEAQVTITSSVPTEELKNSYQSLSFGQQITKKVSSYISSRPFVQKINSQTKQQIVSLKNFLLKFLHIIKWIFWISTAGIIMTRNFVADETTNILIQFFSLTIMSWLIGLVSPHLVVNFGLVETVNNELDSDLKAKVSIFYSLLTAIVFGLLLANSSLFHLSQVKLNNMQNWLLGFSGLTMIFTLSYPEGSIMNSMVKQNPHKNRFAVVLTSLVVSSLLILITGYF